MKRFSLYFFGFCTLLCLIFYGCWHYLAPDYITQTIISECEKKLGVSPQFKTTPELSLFPLTAKFDDVQWQGQPKEWFQFSVHSLQIEIKSIPLLAGQLEIAEIILDRPNLVLEEELSTPPSHSLSVFSGKSIQLDRLVIQDGFFSWKGNNSVIRMEDIKLAAENSQPRKETDLRCDFTIHAQKKDSDDKFNGNLAIKGKLHYYYPNLTFRQTSASYTHLDGDPLLFPLQFALEGALNLENLETRLTLAQITAPAGQIRLKGAGGLSPFHFSGETNIKLDSHLLAPANDFGLPKKLVIASPVDIDMDRINLPVMAISLDNSSGSGNLLLGLPKENSPLSLDGRISAGILTLSPEQKTQGTAPQNQLQPAKIAQSPSFPDINLTIELASLKYRNLAFNKIFLNLAGSNGIYKISPFSLEFAGGLLKGEAQVALSAAGSQISFSGDKIDFGQAMQEMGLDGFDKGIFSFNGDINANGLTPQQMLSSMNGKGLLAVHNSRLALLEDIGLALAFLGKRPTDYSGVNIQAPFTITEGKMDVMPIAIQSPTLTGRGQAFINLPQGFLDSRINFRFGVLDIPLTFRGPFGKIDIGIAPDFNQHPSDPGR